MRAQGRPRDHRHYRPSRGPHRAHSARRSQRRQSRGVRCRSARTRHGRAGEDARSERRRGRSPAAVPVASWNRFALPTPVLHRRVGMRVSGPVELLAYHLHAARQDSGARGGAGPGASRSSEQRAVRNGERSILIAARAMPRALSEGIAAGFSRSIRTDGRSCDAACPSPFSSRDARSTAATPRRRAGRSNRDV